MVMMSLTVAAVILLAGIGASDAAVRIAQDPGGRIKTYVDKYQGVRSSGAMVVIDGDVQVQHMRTETEGGKLAARTISFSRF
jgi:hypothetical protein